MGSSKGAQTINRWFLEIVRKFFINSILLFTSIICCLIILDFGVRFIMPHYDPSGHVNFTTNTDGVPISAIQGSFRQIKNTGDYNVEIKINSLGLRDNKELKSSTPLDYFVVGDSFSFGWGVEEEERFSNVLDQLLPRSRVFNISIPTDFDGYQKLISYAEKNGALIKNLIIGVTMENDIQNYNLSTKPINKKPFRPAKRALGLTAIKYFLRDNSAVYFFITSIIQQNPKLRAFAQNLGLIVSNLKVIKNQTYDKERIQKSARKLHSISKNIEILVLLIPSRGLWVGEPEDRKIARQIHQSFISEIKKFKIEYIDLRQIMELADNPMGFHFKNDGHWTRKAHNIAGVALAKRINSRYTHNNNFIK